MLTPPTRAPTAQIGRVLFFELAQYRVAGVGTSETDIRAAGLRCTAQRIAVLEVLRSRRHHYRAEELSGLVAEHLGTVSTQAVYDALGALVGVGLARRIEPAGSAALFEAGAGDNHHHLVCRDCGVVVDIECLVGPAPCIEVPDTPGFVVDEAEITFWGRCPECVAKQPSRRATGESAIGTAAPHLGPGATETTQRIVETNQSKRTSERQEA